MSYDEENYPQNIELIGCFIEEDLKIIMKINISDFLFPGGNI